jgi:hypothetical protein
MATPGRDLKASSTKECPASLVLVSWRSEEFHGSNRRVRPELALVRRPLRGGHPGWRCLFLGDALGLCHPVETETMASVVRGCFPTARES